MPSRKGFEQAVTWLKSKIAEKDTFDAINAEVCYNVLMDLKKRRQVIGALYHQERAAKRKQEEELERLYCCAVDAFDRYSMTRVDVELPEEWERGG